MYYLGAIDHFYFVEIFVFAVDFLTGKQYI